jgi:phage-related protein
MDKIKPKPVVWIGSSRKDYKEFPAPVQSEMGYDLYQAQLGEMSHHAKPLKGFAGAEVIEIRDNYLGDTFRAVYTVRYAEAIYVLHAFQKKSKSGIATPKQEIDIVHQRLKTAERHFKDWLANKGKGHEKA